MEMTPEAKTMYYKARADLQINNLPYFFGRVEIRNDKIIGRHYEPKFNKLTDSYSIGYYRVEEEVADFLQAVQTHGDVEITEEEFKSLLSRWTQDAGHSPVCWGSGQVLETASTQSTGTPPLPPLLVQRSSSPRRSRR